MPIYNNGYVYRDTTTGSSTWRVLRRRPLTNAEIQQEYEEWKQECEKQDNIVEQRSREEEERRDDMIKYPLFYWRETCKKEKK